MTLKQRIKAIPGEEGWWKSGSEKAFYETAKQMIEKGFNEDETVDILEDLYGAVAECYGV